MVQDLNETGYRGVVRWRILLSACLGKAGAQEAESVSAQGGSVPTNRPSCNQTCEPQVPTVGQY